MVERSYGLAEAMDRIAALEAEVERLRGVIEDWETVASHAASEKCDHPGMIHCSCVPLLRKENKRLRGLVKDAFHEGWGEADGARRDWDVSHAKRELLERDA